jgi:hypothetical protein
MTKIATRHTIGYMNLLGDGIHNFIDGLIAPHLHSLGIVAAHRSTKSLKIGDITILV